MNKEVIKRWIKALQSGDYVQLIGILRHGDKFCATGVLCDLHSKEFRISWDIRDLMRYDIYLQHGQAVPDEVIEWSGITYEQASSIAGWNDEGMPFKEMASHIEFTLGVNDE